MIPFFPPDPPAGTALPGRGLDAAELTPPAPAAVPEAAPPRGGRDNPPQATGRGDAGPSPTPPCGDGPDTSPDEAESAREAAASSGSTPREAARD